MTEMQQFFVAMPAAPEVKLFSICDILQVGNSVYYNYVLSVNGRREKHGTDYDKDYLTKLIVSTFLCITIFVLYWAQPGRPQAYGRSP